MSRPRRVPLAWKNLTHDPVRFVLFSAGIGFAVVLMGVQLGILNAMLDANTVLLQRLNADIVLVNPNKVSLMFREGVGRHRLKQAAAVPGVASVHPLYLEYELGRLRHTAPTAAARSPTRRIRVVGVDPAAGVLDLPEVNPAGWTALNTPGTALYDRQTRADPDRPGETVFGRFAPGVRTQLAGRNLTLVGGFDLGFDFSCDGTLVVGDRTFATYLREPYYGTSAMAEADLGLIRVGDGEDIGTVKRRLRAALGNQGDVEVLTKDEMIARERGFWARNTPIGFAFGAGVVLGFIVGLVICYQILASDVADHLAEYATLKAIGYPNSYLNRVVLLESLILAVAGFLPGVAITSTAYSLLTGWTGLPLRLTPGRFGLVFGLTVVMCMLSGWMALGKVKKVDPADVF